MEKPTIDLGDEEQMHYLASRIIERIPVSRRISTKEFLEMIKVRVNAIININA